ncbi:hypothetical protein CSOJ01_08955 [Colletotrichum sojae]|uniref:Uncharacterized protein n=1 Tax=Colletotrichum sojae TaxID=2175907 RepID=A0A8H6J4X1_9PEZI|nr:hypothetical protein CSOJ01_08955 [Colletotrichum sojae]
MKYYYQTRVLVLVYVIVVLLAVLGVVAGAVAFRRNGGVSRNSNFSSIVAATRSNNLNKVDWDGPEKDRGNVSSDVMHRRLGYGQVRTYQDGGEQGSTRAGHDEDVKYGFGFEGDVDQSTGTRK